MNKCPKCGTDFEGNFCPECGTSVAGKRLCPNCKKTVPADAKFCKECGFTLTPQVQPSQKKKPNVKAWVKAHKKAVVLTAIVLALVLILAIVIPVVIVNRHNGTYYYYENGEYHYEKYFILRGNSYTDETGYTCDVEFSGDGIKMYADLFGEKNLVASGTVKDGILKVEIMGAEITYLKKGHVHKLKEEILKEATCEEAGSSISSCECGYRESEPQTIPAKGHEFDNNYICRWCGLENGVLLSFSLNKEETAYTVTGIGNCKDSVIIIPNEYKGLPVTSIGDKAFLDCKELMSVTIPDNVTSIGDEVFNGCTNTTKFVVTAGNTAYSNSQNGVLYDKAQTKIVAVPRTFKGAFIIPDSVTEIGNSAFRGCYELSGELKLPDGVTKIGSYAFWGCRYLNSIDLPDTVTEIGEGAFYDCNRLTSITIPDGVTSIGKEMFRGCIGLTEITIPNSVATIGSDAFAFCSELAEIHYNGTIDDWKKIEIDDSWNGLTGDYTVICTDGTITKDGKETKY